MKPQIRPGIRQPDPSASASPWRQMAPRWGRRQLRREEALALVAVDQDGFVLDVLVQSRRDKEAAKRLFRKLLNKLLKKQEEAGSSPSCARHRQA
jgi:hypothetical protein